MYRRLSRLVTVAVLATTLVLPPATAWARGPGGGPSGPHAGHQFSGHQFRGPAHRGHFGGGRHHFGRQFRPHGQGRRFHSGQRFFSGHRFHDGRRFSRDVPGVSRQFIFGGHPWGWWWHAPHTLHGGHLHHRAPGAWFWNGFVWVWVPGR